MPISPGFCEWGCPKRWDSHITVTPGDEKNGRLGTRLNGIRKNFSFGHRNVWELQNLPFELFSAGGVCEGIVAPHGLELVKRRKIEGKENAIRHFRTRENWTELTFAKTSGTVTREWPIADRRVPSNHPRNNCGKLFGSSSLLVCKVAKVISFHLYCGLYQL